MSLNSLLSLVLDDNFQKLERNTSKNNLFRIAGRTHTETWHSTFLGWILDPSASHVLNYFPLRKLLLSCTRDNNFCDLSKRFEISKIIASDNIKIIRQLPCESNQKEHSVAGVGRFDGFIEFSYSTHLNPEVLRKAIILIEQKVKDVIDKEACRKYLAYLENEFPLTDHLIIPIFLSPEDHQVVSSVRTYGSEKWFGLNYQDIYDSILNPAITNSDISLKARDAIIYYVETLKTPHNGRKLIMTNEERELAREIYKKHKTTFEKLREILKTEEPEITSMIQTDDEICLLQLTANGTSISGETVRDFYKNCLDFVFLQGKGKDLIKNLPISTSDVRYMISNDGIHPRGNPFYTPLLYKPDIIIEAHVNRTTALRYMSRFLGSLDFKVE